MPAYYISSKLIDKFLRKWALKFMTAHTAMTLNEGQGHLKKIIKLQSSVVSISTPGLKETGLQKANIIIYAAFSSYQQVSTPQFLCLEITVPVGWALNTNN